jgi:O-antigen/teichoic acid export membrane protein
VPPDPVDQPAQPSLDLRVALKRIVRNAAGILLGSASGEILTGYALVLSALTLGRAGFGKLSSAQALVEPFEQLASFGLALVAVAKASERGGCDGELRGTTLGIRLSFGVLASLAAIALAFATGRGDSFGILVVVCLGMLCTQGTAVALMPFEFDQAMHKPVAFPFLASVVRLATAYLAVYCLATPVGFQLSGLAAGLTSLALNVWLSRRLYRARFSFDWRLGRELLQAGWPIAAIQFIGMMYMRGSYFLLHSADLGAQGEYAAADRLVRPVLTLGGVLFMSSLPTLATLASEGRYAQMMAAYKKTVLRVVLVALPALGAVWVSAPWLLRRFVPDYAGATWPLRLLSIGTIFMCLNQLAGTFVYALQRQKLIMWVALANFVSYFSLALFLIPRYGATGAAGATMLMEGLNTLQCMAIVVYLLRRARAVAPSVP